MTNRRYTITLSTESFATVASCDTRPYDSGSANEQKVNRDRISSSCTKKQNGSVYRTRCSSSPSQSCLSAHHAWAPLPERPRTYNNTNTSKADSNLRVTINKRLGPVNTAAYRKVSSSGILRTRNVKERVGLKKDPKENGHKNVGGRITQKLSTGTFVQPVIDNDADREREKSELALQRLRKFQHAVRLMRVLSAFCLSIRRYAEQDKSRIYDLYYLRDTLPTTKGRPVLVQDNAVYFDKNIFSRESTLHFPLWARLICTKTPDERTEAEIHKLVTLLRGIKSFGRFSRQAQVNLCRTMTYACYEKRRIIVRQGHPGFCFYFIVSGSVSVTVTRKDVKTGISVTNTVDVLVKNDAFGEIALISKEARRTATIMCRERVEVLLVDRETVLQYCPNVFHREHQEKVQVLRKHDLFENWTKENLEIIAHEAQIKEYSHGKLIDPNTTTSEAVHFVIKGRAEILRRLDLSASRTTNLPKRRAQSAPARNNCSRLVYINIGALFERQAWDLNCLCLGPSGRASTPCAVISLMSSGVRLLRVPKKRIMDLCPRTQLEHFSREFTPGPLHRFSSDERLYMDYAAEQQWVDYKEKVLLNVMDEKYQHPIAHRSRTAKGFSELAWPGE